MFIRCSENRNNMEVTNGVRRITFVHERFAIPSYNGDDSVMLMATISLRKEIFFRNWNVQQWKNNHKIFIVQCKQKDMLGRRSILGILCYLSGLINELKVTKIVISFNQCILFTNIGKYLYLPTNITYFWELIWL